YNRVLDLYSKRSKYFSNQLYENLHNFHYNSDSESVVYEKIAFTKYPSLTLDNLITYKIKNYSNLTPVYPKYKSFSNF
ncbi:hypothetical protein NAI69_10330, partial [Francisella tularensis subsp. holarctica]|uniref:hypothetical protein n=1 Tax=Francisella tularensis TaxID=263 RepID=UPI002381ABFE